VSHTTVQPHNTLEQLPPLGVRDTMSDSGGGEGLGQWLVDLVMKPGSSVQLVPFINGVLCILVALLVYVAASGEGSIHVYVMGFL
ncbi:unnamed protein product, partial [Ectocarpus sp. 12 AP-2014]